MSKTPFNEGTILTSAWVQGMQNLKFNKNLDEELNDGEYFKLGNDSLLNEPGNIVYDFELIKEDISDVIDTSIRFGGNGYDGVFESDDGDVLDRGIYNFSEFNVRSGHTVYINKFAKIYCTEGCLIDGELIVKAATKGGAGTFLPIVNDSIVGRFKGDGFGGTEDIYHWSMSPLGTGGSSGSVRGVGNKTSGVQTNIPARGGKGGGSLYIESKGNIRVGGKIKAVGENGNDGIANNEEFSSGGGGGSGGSIVLVSDGLIKLDSTAFICVNGGNGGNSVKNSSLAEKARGGHGGGGGHIEFRGRSYEVDSNSEIEIKGGFEGDSSGAENSIYIRGGFGGSFAGLGGTGSVEDEGKGAVGDFYLHLRIPTLDDVNGSENA